MEHGFWWRSREYGRTQGCAMNVPIGVTTRAVRAAFVTREHPEHSLDGAGHTTPRHLFLENPVARRRGLVRYVSLTTIRRRHLRMNEVIRLLLSEQAKPTRSLYRGTAGQWW